MITVKLPNDQWAELRDVSELRSRDRKAVNSSFSLGADPETKMPIIPGDIDDKMMDALLTRIIINWSFDIFPVPAEDPESLGRLDLETYDALAEAASEHMDVIKRADNRPTRPSAS